MRLICIHQSADLYGSDRSFLQVLEYFVKTERYSEITVVLPRKGPLMDKIIDLGVTVQLLDLSLLSKTYLKQFQWGKILFPLLQFGKKRKLLQSYDLVYVNTSVILDFYLIAPFLDNKKIIHIREIPTKWLGKVLSMFLRFSKSTIIFNSFSTQQGFDSLPNSHVVHNAFEGFKVESGQEKPLSEEDDSLKVLLIGRINDWKGQDFAIDALKALNDKKVILRLVGDTSKGNEHLVDLLKKQTHELGVSLQVEFAGFAANPAVHYLWTDVLIVPSKKPEPFGRIAIEAMSLGKPVIAANHGGLPEIITHGHDGFLFEPNDIQSFNNCLQQYLSNRALLLQHGRNAFDTYEKKFSSKTMYANIDLVLKKMNIQ